MSVVSASGLRQQSEYLQKEKVRDALVAFVLRVSGEDFTKKNPEEVEVLPGVLEQLSKSWLF